MNLFWHKSALGLAIAGVGVLGGCGSNTSSSTTETGANNTVSTSDNSASATTTTTGTKTLNGAGASFPYPLYSKWFETYREKNGVAINYQSVGSGAGINQLKQGTVDFGASDAPLGSKDKAGMPGEVATIPTVAGAVVVAYNLPGAPQNLKMDGPTIANIYLGKITKWNDPAIARANPGVTLPAQNITVARRSDSSGTTNIFTNFLAAASPEWKSKIGAGKAVDFPVGLGGKGNDGVTKIVKQSSGGVGYVELAYAKQNKLPYASVKNQAGQFVIPSVAATTAAAEGALGAVQKDITAPIANAPGARAYPIAGFTYIMVFKGAKDPAKGKALVDFLSWANTDGQKQAAALDYAPLPPAIVELNAKTIASLK